MATLRDSLLGQNRTQVISATVRLIDSEIAGKRGLRAMPLKGAYKLVKGLSPGFVPKVVDAMLPEFCDALEPYYQTWVEAGDSRGSLESALKRDERKVADALLAVADRRVENAKMPGVRAVQKAYRKLRGTAKDHVITALPGLGRSVEPFLSDPGQ